MPEPWPFGGPHVSFLVNVVLAFMIAAIRSLAFRSRCLVGSLVCSAAGCLTGNGFGISILVGFALRSILNCLGSQVKGCLCCIALEGFVRCLPAPALVLLHQPTGHHIKHWGHPVRNVAKWSCQRLWYRHDV